MKKMFLIRPVFLSIFLFVIMSFVLKNSNGIAQVATTYQVNPSNVLHQIDKKVYGQFFEHIYNSANNGLWGDLVWNRSLERTSGTSGVWSIEGEEIVQSTLSEDVRLLFGDTSWENYEFTLEAQKTGGNEGFLIIFRANGDRFYWANLGGWGNTEHAIERSTANGRGVVGSQISGSIATGVWNTIRIRCEGNNFQIWLNDTRIFNYTDPAAHMSGQVGLGTWITQARYRNPEVKSLDTNEILFSGLPEIDENSPISLDNWIRVGGAQTYANSNALNSYNCVKLVNPGNIEAGIQQAAFNFKNQNYSGSFWARGTSPAGIRVSLFRGGTALDSKDFPAPGDEWQEYKFDLNPGLETMNGSLRISLPDSGTIYLDQISMMSQDAIDNDGFRVDLYEAIAALRPPIIRWPGGYFAEYYRWKDGIGAQHERGLYPIEAWNDQDVNSLGTDEFMTLCEKLNSDKILVINIGHRFSLIPQQEYIEEAQNWVEYCNGDASTTWGAKRAANGHPEPYNVQYWEISNEVWLTSGMTATVYSNFLKTFVPALKEIDPDIKIIACGSGSYDQAWNRTVISQCAEIIDYISLHHYEDSENYISGVKTYENHLTELGDIIKTSKNPNIKIYMSEWNFWEDLDWRIGLYAGGMLNTFERNGDIFKIGGPALFLRHQSAGSAWNNAFINFNNYSWYPAPNYVVMKFWWNHYAPNYIELNGTNAFFNSVATSSEDGDIINFKVISASGIAREVILDIDACFVPQSAELKQIAPASLNEINSYTNPDNIHVETGTVQLSGQQAAFTVPPYGAVIVTISKNPGLGVSDNQDDGAITDYKLYSNYPNPFNPHTIIQYDLPKTEKVQVRVVDVLGRTVSVLVNQKHESGHYQTMWHGKNDQGQPVSSGIYFYELITESHKSVKKMILVR